MQIIKGWQHQILELRLVRIGATPAILRSCFTLDGAKISSAGICIHQPQRSITRHAEEFDLQWMASYRRCWQTGKGLVSLATVSRLQHQSANRNRRVTPKLSSMIFRLTAKRLRPKAFLVISPPALWPVRKHRSTWLRPRSPILPPS
jgi:hypothetical protein